MHEGASAPLVISLSLRVQVVGKAQEHDYPVVRMRLGRTLLSFQSL